MTMRRPRPYIWATWLASALGGDNCEWKHWFKAHYQDYDKRPESDESRNRLRMWAADHDAQVRTICGQLATEGWATIRREGETKFNISGVHATVGGKADVLAFGAAESQPSPRSVRLNGDLLAGVTPAERRALVIDVKTGRPSEKDYWQVVVYLIMLPIAFKPDLEGLALSGEVRYTNPSVPEGERILKVAFDDVAKAQVFARIKEIADAGSRPPPRTPSARECRFCDIWSCEDRVESDAPDAETEEF